MAQDNSPNKTITMNQRRSRTKFTEDQLKILIKAFDQNPYPGYATKQRLALEINTDESRIQIWFQNRRARHQCQKKSEPDEDLESSQDQDHSEEEIQSREDRRCRTSYTSSQLHTLIGAFMNNPYPGIDTREQLAKEIGIPESRVQIWFQNRRSRFHVQRKREPDDQDSEQRQDQEQDLWDERVQDNCFPNKLLGLFRPNKPTSCLCGSLDSRSTDTVPAHEQGRPCIS
ncbi:double homeobox protein A-like [Callorhinus ursinus]|uniref:Double homeobox protein A-like n=1 Tax=Callorhinus ursinus TaxID=34884 RepID=A0A3Q7R4M6_CALUR|nr:double homeobox protein A-like [Callorhinus ursinus]XP_025735375.1 double homeobox protein A-like [Callorhinus ursinus]